MFLYQPAICSADLPSALFVPTSQALTGVLVGVASLFGWGLMCELVALRKRDSCSLSHAFVQGIVLIPILRTVTAVFGYCNTSWLLALIGSLGAIGAVLFLWKRKIPVEELNFTWMPVSVRVSWVVMGLLVFAKLIIFPLSDWDTIAIGGYHAKALTCECLFSADYIKEPYWAGSHPDYPPQLAYLFSYFFSLMGSFRDDWIKIWMGFAYFALSWISVEAYFRKGVRTNHLQLVLLLLAVFFFHYILDGKSEFLVVTFALLSWLAIWNDTPQRLPLYLLGLAFSKSEGLVGSFVILALFAAHQLRKSPRKSMANIAVCGLSIFLATLVIINLPSRHEQYSARLLDISAWMTGLSSLPIIVKGWLAYWFSYLPGAYFWTPVLLFLPYQWNRHKELRIGWLWCAAMVPIFTAIYIVTPWDSNLYQRTIERIMLPYFMILLFSFAASIGLEAWSGKGHHRTRTLACWYFLIALGFVFAGELRQTASQFNKLSERNALGISYYQVEPLHAHSLKIDRQIPIGADIALVHGSCFHLFRYNYLLYPRKIYTAPRDLVACTWRPWQSFQNEKDARDSGFDRVFDSRTW